MNHNQQGVRSSNHSDRSRAEIKVIYPSLDSKELLGDDAFKLAETIVDKCKSIGKRLSRTQVRRFYSEVKNIERCIPEDCKSIDDSIYGRIKLIKAKAAYSTARKSNPLPTPFSDFLSHYVNQIKIIDGPEKAMQNFKKFCKLFEAFVGYSIAMDLSD